MLADRNVRNRQHALRLLRHRGPAAGAALPAVLEAMRTTHPQGGFTLWQDNGSVRTGQISRDDEVHRLAAEVVLAIAPHDDDATRAANEVLRKLAKPR